MEEPHLASPAPSPAVLLQRDASLARTVDYDSLDTPDVRVRLPRHHEVEDPKHLAHIKSRRYCCGCFSSRKTCLTVWCCYLGLLLLAISIAVYILLPRIPLVTIGVPYVPPGLNNSGLTMNRDDKGNLIKLEIEMRVNVTVNSTNNWDYYIGSIVASGNLLNQSRFPIDNAAGSGSLTNIIIPSNKMSRIVMPITLEWHTIGLELQRDPAIMEMAACVLQTPPSTFRAAYEFVIDMPIISWTGYKFTQKGGFEYNVSQLPRDQRANILRLVSQILMGGNV
ncbi:hypothetical protein HDV03_002621 [Kappamyces sp. JEL0829]|nr:hypothetical protein HDV03_002621 [Kappamyces sp. JEL0829]